MESPEGLAEQTRATEQAFGPAVGSIPEGNNWGAASVAELHLSLLERYASVRWGRVSAPEQVRQVSHCSMT